MAEDIDIDNVSIDWVYANLICEFDHYDICLKGLVNRDGEKWFCRIIGDITDDPVRYKIRKVQWNDACEEYLRDYRDAFYHWFHEGKPRSSYDGRDFSWFSKKWKGVNPIKNQVIETE